MFLSKDIWRDRSGHEIRPTERVHVLQFFLTVDSYPIIDQSDQRLIQQN